MSSNTNTQGKGVVQQATDAIANAAESVKHTLGQGTEATAKEASKEQAKGNTPNNSITDQVVGAKDTIAHKAKEEKHAALK